MRALLHALLLPCVLSACFTDRVPDNAIILCTSSDDCPAAVPVCAEARHECVAEGSDLVPPGLVSAAFDPPAARSGTVALVLVADEALADAPPVVRFVQDPAPVLEPAGGAGAERRFSLAVDALAEGIYLVTRVVLRDSAGNEADTPVDGTALEVDRTPPAIHDFALVDGPADGIYADLDSPGIVRTSLVASFSADDVIDLAATSLTVGARTSSACTQSTDATASIRCTLDLDDPLTDNDDDAPVLLRTADTAGNAVERVVFARIDAQAPQIAAASVAIEVAGVGPVSAALPGARIVVTVTADEELGAPPTGRVRLGVESLALSQVSGSGRTWQLAADVVDVFGEGNGVVELSMTDVAGHVAPLLVVAEPVPFGVAIVSACAVPVSIACSDADGDGLSPVLGCDAVADCNDLDATVYPGAVEIPGDGVGNDCTGADLPLDESTGVFFDDTAPAGGDGSRDAPFSSDADLGSTTAPFIFVRAGSAVGDFDGVVRRSMIGGLDASWSPDAGTRSFLRVTDNSADLRLEGEAAFVRMDLFTPDTSLIVTDGQTTLVDTITRDPVAIFGILRGVRFDARRSLSVQPGSVANLIDSTVLDVDSDGILRTTRSFINDKVQLLATGQLHAVSSLFRSNNAFAATVACVACSVVRIDHSTLLRDPSASAQPVLSVQGDAMVRIDNSVLHQVTSRSHLKESAGDALWTLHNNVLSRSTLGSALFEDAAGAVLYAEADALNTCDDNGALFCADVSDNRVIEVPDDVGLIPTDEPHLTLSSPAVDSAGAAGPDSSGSVLLDIDGACRYDDGAADIGADEVGG